MCYAADMAAEAEVRGDLAKANFWLRIKAKVDEAPPLTTEQRSQLRILLAAPAPARKSTAA
jgi:acetoacetate decarboxylase